MLRQEPFLTEAQFFKNAQAGEMLHVTNRRDAGEFRLHIDPFHDCLARLRRKAMPPIVRRYPEMNLCGIAIEREQEETEGQIAIFKNDAPRKLPVCGPAFFSPTRENFFGLRDRSMGLALQKPGSSFAPGIGREQCLSIGMRGTSQNKALRLETGRRGAQLIVPFADIVQISTRSTFGYVSPVEFERNVGLA